MAAQTNQTLLGRGVGGEPIIQATHRFLCSLIQEHGISIQNWHTEVHLHHQRCDFPSEAADRLQRDTFVIGLNDTFKRFRSDIIARDNFASLTFAQVVANARDDEDGLKTETTISQHQLEESANKVSSLKPTQHQQQATITPGSKLCIWCGRFTHPRSA